MHKQLVLFEVQLQQTQNVQVRVDLERKEQEAAIHLLAELMVQSVVNEYKEQNRLVTSEKKARPNPETQKETDKSNDLRETIARESSDE